jgi:phosphoserine phosphatase RsbU/P
MSVLPSRAWTLISARPHVWLAMVIIFNTVVAVIGVIIGTGFNLTGLQAAGPLLACARCDERVTVVVGVYSVALCLLVGQVTGQNGLQIQRERAAVVLMSAVLATLVAIIRTRRESKLIRIAERVQQAILRPLPTELGGVGFASHYQSATPGTLVGGDLYDLTMTQFGPRFIIGDVKGKGLEAVGRCAAVIASFRALAFAEPDLIRLAEQMDASLSGEMGGEDFVTAVLAEFGAGEVHIVNCGHHPPVKSGPGAGVARSEIIAPEQPALPLGLHPSPVQQDVVLKQGDRLLFYTDGLVEARDQAGRFLDLDERVLGALTMPGLEACAQRLGNLILEHTGHTLGDDALLVVCEPLALPS